MIKCDICGRDFKNKAGLAGHKKIAHGTATRKTIPDEIGKRLEALEKGLHDRTMVLLKNDNKIMDTMKKVVEKLSEAFKYKDI